MDQKGSPASWKEGGKKKKAQTKHPTQKRKERGKKALLKKNTVNGESQMGSGGLNLALWFGSKLAGAPQVVEREEIVCVIKRERGLCKLK